jgi:hypothetical protein
LGREELTGGVGLSVREGEAPGYRFGKRMMGRGPPLVLGRKGAPGLFIYFSFLFFLFFSVFLFLS